MIHIYKILFEKLKGIDDFGEIILEDNINIDF
jgi:hypothetical protein